MDRFVVREPRNYEDYPQGNQMMGFATNAAGSNMVPLETMYFSGPFASEFPNVEQPNMNMRAPHNMVPQHNMRAQNDTSTLQNLDAQHNMSVYQNISVQRNMGYPHNTNAQRSMNTQHNMVTHHPMDAQHVMSIPQNGTKQNTSAQNMSGQNNMDVRHNINRQGTQSFGQKNIAGQVPGQMSGIDPEYLAGYTDSSAQFVVSGQHIQRNGTPINCSFGSDYQNRAFNAIDRTKQKSFTACAPIESLRVQPKPQLQQPVARNSNKENIPQNHSGFQPKKPNELDLLRNDIQNQIVTRADKLKALNKAGPRSFSGPVEKVLKWHKSLQDIGILIFYEIVAKCVSVRPGELGSKVMVVRDDSGPAMQVVYYEIDFLLPELKPPCTVRVIGRMMAGTCRLQAFNVRPATGDDVATLPRRAAVAAHHVAKMCKEYGHNPAQNA